MLAVICHDLPYIKYVKILPTILPLSGRARQNCGQTFDLGSEKRYIIFSCKVTLRTCIHHPYSSSLQNNLGCGMAQLGCGVAQLGCGVAQFRVRRGSVRVLRGSVGRAPACCKAGPSWNPGSAPQGGSPTEPTAMKKMEMGLS
jgi:hypothetical protein